MLHLHLKGSCAILPLAHAAEFAMYLDGCKTLALPLHQLILLSRLEVWSHGAYVKDNSVNQLETKAWFERFGMVLHSSK